MKKVIQIILLFCFFNGFSQEKPNFNALDSLYREDQFYLNLTYNILINKPSGISQNSLSSGLCFGFLRDFPINKLRTIAIAPGLGFSFSNYKENLVVNNQTNPFTYSEIPSSVSYDKNKLGLYFVEVPLEFRWRTSTPESHKFWRIYGGVKMSYLLYSRSRFIADGIDYKIDSNPDLNKIQYGVYLSTGYNGGNAYVYYGLQDIFKNATFNDNPIKMRTLNIGLIVYVL
jgi:hypothetical protein